MTIAEMKEKKKELGYSNAKLSELSGIPEATIQKIFSGTTTYPRYNTLRALEAVFNNIPNTSVLKDTAIDYSAKPPMPPYSRQGTYTAADRNRIPDDIRTELIDGVLYDMAAPVTFHQLIGGKVYQQIANFIDENSGDCVPFMAPVDVYLDKDDRTVVQPDVLIVCNPDLFKDGYIYGAPDFILEVISPSTGRKDYTKKLAKYEAAGVREYWIIDPYKRRVFVYFFEDDTFCPALYQIDDKIPVNIYDGKLEIDLTAILKWLPE